MKATEIYRRDLVLERRGLKRLRTFLEKQGYKFTVDHGHGRDGYIDGVVPVEVKVNSHTRHRPPGTFPAHISAKQLQMIRDGGLLIHVNDLAPHIFIYDKEAITKTWVSQYAIRLNHKATLNKTALDRHVQRMQKKSPR